MGPVFHHPYYSTSHVHTFSMVSSQLFFAWASDFTDTLPILPTGAALHSTGGKNASAFFVLWLVWDGQPEKNKTRDCVAAVLIMGLSMGFC